MEWSSLPDPVVEALTQTAQPPPTTLPTDPPSLFLHIMLSELYPEYTISDLHEPQLRF